MQFIIVDREHPLPKQKESKMKTYDIEPIDAVNTAKHVLTGVLVGGLIGATTMWLFAPRAGEDTRNDLLDKASELRDKTAETVKDTVDQVKVKAGSLRGDAMGKAQDLKSIGQDLVVEQLDRAADALKAAKKAIKEY
jgi:gas vesicle protein